MAAQGQMPMRYEHTAPKFDPAKPREIVHYLEDLDNQFTHCGITGIAEVKKWTLKYVPIEVADLWAGLKDWKAAANWPNLQTAVLKCYPASMDSRRHMYQELLTLIREHLHKEIDSMTEWNEFLNKYLAVSQHLVDQSCLSKLKQHRHLLESLTVHFHREVLAHLCNVSPTRDPEDLEEVSKIDEVVSYCLHSPLCVKFEDSPMVIPSTSPAVKQEAPDIALVGLVSQLVQRELVQCARSWGPPPNRLNEGETRVGGAPMMQYSNNCHYCGHQGHIMQQCVAVDEDINFNRCARSPDGRVTLPNSNFLPRMIPGALMRDRINEWHRRNGMPSNNDPVATTSMMLSVEPRMVPTIAEVAMLSNHHLGARFEVNPPQILQRNLQINPLSTTLSASSFPLLKSDQVASLAQELASLQDDEELGDQVAKLVMALNTRGVHRDPDGGRKETQYEAAQTTCRAVPVVKISMLRPPSGPVSKTTPTAQGQNAATSVQVPPASTTTVPEHPYAKAKDAVHRPPPDPVEPFPNSCEPLYRTQPPIYDKEQVERAYQKLLNTPVTVTIRDTLALSPEMLWGILHL